ncbi:MAG: TonB-dependent receptor [Proteobacteria bacterium]|nr:TonB-dependent receptor [Pseudomonadota bacterium]
MNTRNLLKATVAPAALGLAMIAVPAFAQEAAQASADDAAAPAPIVVTGSRIASPNLESVSPVTVVSNADIKITGTTRVEDLLNSLPQVFAGQGSNVSNGATGTATLNLRGLGSDRTLVLVNGRRVVPGDPSSSAADINIIPAAILKRVDVLTGGASSVYGADAVAGVVNFVMDTKFEGFRIDGQYSLYNHNNRAGTAITQELDRRGFGYPKGTSTNGGAVDATLSFGTGFDDGHGHITAYMGYRKVNPVLQSSRDYSSCSLSARSQAQFDKDGRLFACGGSATSANGTLFVYDTVDGAFTSTAYQIGAGRTLDPGFTPYNFAPLNYYQRPDERYTAGLFADYEISEALHPYMEFMFMDDRTVAQIAPSGDFGNTLSLNCDNPLLGAAQKAVVCDTENLLVSADPREAFSVVGNTPGSVPYLFTDPTTGQQYTKGFAQILRRNVEGGARRDDLQHTSYRAVLGTKGQLSKAWNYDVYYQYGRTNYSETYFNDFSVSRLTNALDVVTDPSTGNPVCRVTLQGDKSGCVPYDIFTPGGVSQAALNYLQIPGFQRGINTEQVLSGYVSGDLGEYGLKTPWASDGVGVVLGGEYRKETLDFTADAAYQTGDLAGQGAATLPVKGDYSVKEFFSELRVPLVQDSFIYNLTVTGGYRYSSYNVSGGNSFSTSTYKAEFELAPTRDIRFRGGYNRAVRVPTLQDLFAPQRVALDGAEDPCAGFTITAADAGCLAQGLTVGQYVAPNPAGQYNGFIGGERSLQPETSDTYTVGAVFTPTFLPGFNASVDYFDIKVDGAIQGYGSDAIVSECTTTANPTYCNLVHRDASGSLWRSSDGYVVNLPHNVGGLSTKGIDVTASYNRQVGNIGRVTASFVGTYLVDLITDNGISKAYECAQRYGAVCGSPNPRWRHQMRVGLETKRGMGFSIRWRYFDGVDQDRTSTNRTLTGAVQPANKHIPSVSYFDLGFNARIGDHYTFRLGANNVFDKAPPIVGTPGCASSSCNGNTYAQVYDALGRYIFAGVTLDF